MENLKEENSENKYKKKNKWFKLLIIGSITYFLGVAVLIFTQNSNLFPSIVMLGNFLIPVTYVAFFYERRKLSNVNMTDTVGSFFYGGFLGTNAAAILEPIFITTLNFGTAIIIGIIEELAKILGVLVILKHRHKKLAIDGIILGASSGMGFAALESSGYAFTAFLRSGDSLSASVYTTLLRGILAPLGHGTWTAILVGILFRESAKGRFNVNIRVSSAYLLVILLHGLWDGLPSILYQFPLTIVTLSEILVGVLGIIVLSFLWREAIKQARDNSELDNRILL